MVKITRQWATMRTLAEERHFECLGGKVLIYAQRYKEGGGQVMLEAGRKSLSAGAAIVLAATLDAAARFVGGEEVTPEMLSVVEQVDGGKTKDKGQRTKDKGQRTEDEGLKAEANVN